MQTTGLIQTFLAAVGVAPSDPRFVAVLTTLASPWQTSFDDEEDHEDWEFLERGAEIAIVGGVVQTIFLFTRPRSADGRTLPAFDDRLFEAFGNRARRADVVAALGEPLRQGPGANGCLFYVASPGCFLHLEFDDAGILSMVTVTTYDPNAA